MAKPRKKYRPRYTIEQMREAWQKTVFPRSKEEVDPVEAEKINGALMQSFDALRDGRATLLDMQKLATAANHAMVLCEHGVGAEWFGIVVKSQEFLARAEYHFHEHAEWYVPADGLIAILEMIDVRIAQLSADGYTAGMDYQAAMIVAQRARDRVVITRADVTEAA